MQWMKKLTKQFCDMNIRDYLNDGIKFYIIITAQKCVINQCRYNYACRTSCHTLCKSACVSHVRYSVYIPRPRSCSFQISRQRPKMRIMDWHRIEPRWPSDSHARFRRRGPVFDSESWRWNENNFSSRSTANEFREQNLGQDDLARFSNPRSLSVLV